MHPVQVGALRVAAEPELRPLGVSWQVRRDDAADQHRGCACLVEPWRPGHTGLAGPLPRDLVAGWGLDGVVRPGAARLAVQPPPGLGRRGATDARGEAAIRRNGAGW